MAKIIFDGPAIVGKYFGGVIQKNASGYFWRQLSKSKNTLQESQNFPMECLKQAARLYKDLDPVKKARWELMSWQFIERENKPGSYTGNGSSVFIAWISFLLFAIRCGNNIPFYTVGGVDYPFDTLDFIYNDVFPASAFNPDCPIYNTGARNFLTPNIITWNGKSDGKISMNFVFAGYVPPDPLGYGPQFYYPLSNDWFGYIVFASEPLLSTSSVPNKPLSHLIGIYRPLSYALGNYPNRSQPPFIHSVLPQTNFALCQNPYKSGDFIKYRVFAVTQQGRNSGAWNFYGQIS